MRCLLQRLRPEDRGKNGDQFLDLSVEEWFAASGELVFVEPGSDETGFWAEPEHQDGGASVMHVGVTLYGRRRCERRQGFGLPDVVVPNAPGTVYTGQLTGPTHQVHHEASAAGELLEVPGLGLCGVNVMLRTALFSFNRSRGRATTPSPQVFWEVLVRSLREGFARGEWKLPSLADCIAVSADDLYDQ